LFFKKGSKVEEYRKGCAQEACLYTAKAASEILHTTPHSSLSFSLVIIATYGEVSQLPPAYKTARYTSML